MRQRRTLWLVIVIVAIGFYLWGSGSTPRGQPPMVSLNETNVAQFQQTFNAASSATRLVLLLSPT